MTVAPDTPRSLAPPSAAPAWRRLGPGPAGAAASAVAYTDDLRFLVESVVTNLLAKKQFIVP